MSEGIRLNKLHNRVIRSERETLRSDGESDVTVTPFNVISLQRD